MKWVKHLKSNEIYGMQKQLCAIHDALTDAIGQWDDIVRVRTDVFVWQYMAGNNINTTYLQTTMHYPQ